MSGSRRFTQLLLYYLITIRSL